MKIKKIEIKDFKGTKSATYDFGCSSAIVSGKNGIGKTTIADAFFYLFCGRDNNLTKNPEIFPLDMEEAKPTVSITVDIDGVEHNLKKWQVRKKREKVDGTVEVSTINEYSINEVPKNATTFDEFLNEHGVNTSTLLQFSHPEVFVSQMDNKKERDQMRSTLFGMANSYSDVDIAKTSEDTIEIADLLEKYSFEEIKAMYLVQKKKAVENVENIPQQIIGLEMAKVSDDVSEWNLQKVDLERQIGELQSQINDSDNSIKLSKLNASKTELESQINKIEVDAYAKTSQERNSLVKAISDLEVKTNECQARSNILKNQILNIDAEIESEKKKRDEYGKRYHEEKAKVFREEDWVFDEKSTVCSMCGQTLPQDKIDEIKSNHEKNYANAKEKFEKSKKNLMNEMIDLGNKSKKIEKEILEKKTILENDLSGIEKMLNQYIEQHKELEESLNNMPLKEDLSANEEIITLRDKIAEIDKEIANLGTSNTSDELTSKMIELKSSLSECDKHIASVVNNERIEEQIDELRKEQNVAEQKKADAEKILYLLDEVSKKKNSMLSDDINKHFDFVDFIFFDYQKNGGYVETCIPTVNGKRLGESMNTGLELMAKLDIIRGLQKFYNAEIPVIIDGAECLDNANIKNLPKDVQTILLKVSDDDLKVEVF